MNQRIEQLEKRLAQLRELAENEANSDKCTMVTLNANTTKKDYADFTDQMIAISKNGQTLVLEPDDLRQLEKIVGAKFRR